MSRIRSIRSTVERGSRTPVRAASTVRWTSSICDRSSWPSELATAPVRCCPRPRAETRSALGNTSTSLSGRPLTRAMSLSTSWTVSTVYPAWVIALPTASAAASVAAASGASAEVTGMEPVMTAAARALTAMSRSARGRRASRRIAAASSTAIAMNAEIMGVPVCRGSPEVSHVPPAAEGWLTRGRSAVLGITQCSGPMSAH